MPPLLVPVFVAIGFTGTVTIAGTAVATAAIAANVAFTALSLTANFALQSAAQRKQKKAARRNALNGQGGQSVQQTVRLSVAPRMRHYGRLRVLGSLAFIETRATVIHQLVVFNAGTISGYEEFLVGGKPVLLDADGAVTQQPYWQGASGDPDARSLVRIEWRRGFAEQGASAILSAAYPGEWTADHKLNGLAYAVLACRQVAQERHQTVYNSQIPALGAVILGVPVFDPRDPRRRRPTRTRGGSRTIRRSACWIIWPSGCASRARRSTRRCSRRRPTTTTSWCRARDRVRSAATGWPAGTALTRSRRRSSSACSTPSGAACS